MNINSKQGTNRLHQGMKRVISLIMTVSMLLSLFPANILFADYSQVTGGIEAVSTQNAATDEDAAAIVTAAAAVDSADEDASEDGSQIIAVVSGDSEADTADEIGAAADSADDDYLASGASDAGDADGAGAASDADGAGDADKADNAGASDVDEANGGASDASDAVADADTDADADADADASDTDTAADADVDADTAADADADAFGIMSLDGELDGEFGALAVGDQYTVYFYAGSELFTAQLVTEGSTARYPGSPPADTIPPGYVSFLGWYEPGASDDHPYEFNTPIMANLTLYARYSEMYLVQFMDGFGNVYVSQRVAQNGRAIPLSEQQMFAMPIPIELLFDYWTLNASEPSTPFSFNTPVTSDLILYSKLAEKVVVFFISYGSEVPAIQLKKGQTVAKPTPNPTRANFTFNRWTLDSNGAGPEYNWNAPVNENTVIYASWTGVTNSVNYKIVWWLEAPSLDHDPVPGTASDYVYADSRVLPGTPGEIAAITPLPPYSGDRPLNDPLRYSEFQSSTPKVISGAGNTIVSVYVKRKVYTITFDLLSGIFYMSFKDGSGTYFGDEYKLDVKFEQDVTKVWPSTMTVTSGPPGLDFLGWETPENLLNLSPPIVGPPPTYESWLTRRNVISFDMMPKNPELPGYTLSVYKGNLGEHKVRYLFEAYPGQTGAARDYKGTRYIIETGYNQDDVPMLNPKAINGLVYEGLEYSDYEFGEGSDDSTKLYQFIYYKRNQHTLIYDMGGAAAIPSVQDVMFDRPLASFKPSPDPVWAGYEFKGWYQDGDYTLGFDFNTAKMPPNTDLTVFAKFESLDNVVTFYDGSEKLGQQGVKDGMPVSLSNLEFNGVIYNLDLYIEGKGYFLGWLYQPFDNVDMLIPFPEDLLVYHNMDLYVHWKADGYHVTYYTEGAGAGSIAPIDSAEYSMQTMARVLSGSMNPPAAGQTFLGWRHQKQGMTYYPGSLLRIIGDMHMYPYFVPDGQTTFIYYNNNYPGNVEEVARRVERNTNVPLSDASVFTKTPPDSILLGWQTAPNGGTFYSLNDTYPIGTLPVILYAVWSSRDVTITYDGNGALDYPTPYTATVQRNTNVNVTGLAPTGLVKVGRELVGWSTVRDDASTRIISNLYVTDSMTVYALWSDYEVYANIAFDKNGADEGATTIKQVLIHDTVNFDAIGPTFPEIIRYGYDLAGWSTTANDPGTRVTTRRVDNDMMVYALWSAGPIYVTLTYDRNNGDTNPLYPVQVLKHTPVTLSDYQPDNLRRPGFVFNGWSTILNNEGSRVTELRVSQNTTVFALWDSRPGVDLTFNGNGALNGLNSVTYVVSVAVNSTQTLANIQPTGINMFRNPGYAFDGWMLTYDGSATVTAVDVGTTPVTVYAKWRKVNDVSLVFNGNGGVNKQFQSEYPVQVPVNSRQILAERQPTGDNMFRNAGYAFDGWMLSPFGDTTVTEVDIDAVSVTVYAKWVKLNDVKLTFNGNGGKNKIGAGEETYSVDVPVNSTQNLAARQPVGDYMFKRPGYAFLGWSESQGGSIVLSVDILTVEKIVYAQWQKLPDVTLIFNGNGGVNKGGSGFFPVQVEVNSTQTLALIEPKGDDMFRMEGFVCKGWSGTATGTTPLVTLDIGTASATVYAIWEPAPPVNVIFDGNGGKNAFDLTTYTVSVPANSTRLLSVIQPTGDNMFVNSGNAFVGWTLIKDDAATIVTSIDIGVSPVTVFALWSTHPLVPLTFYGNGGTNKVSATSYTTYVPANTQTTLAQYEPTGPNMFVREGYVFDGWMETSGGPATVTSVFVGVTEKMVFAKWLKVNDVKLTFNGNGGKNAAGLETYSVDVPVNSTQLLASRQPVGANMFTMPGYEFMGWMETPGGSLTVSSVEIGTTEKVVYALWNKVPDVLLTFKGNGGADKNGIDEHSATVMGNSTVTLAAYEPTGDNMFRREGYHFDGWTTTENGTVTVTTVEVAKAPVTVYAKWTKLADVKLTFNGNGGVNKAGANTYAVDVPVNSTQYLSARQPTGDNMFKKEGYNFIGWTTVPDSQTSFVTQVDILEAGVTVYAYWVKAPDVSVVFIGNGGLNSRFEGVFTVANIPVNSTQTVSAIEPKGADMFTMSGRNFLGWTTVQNDPATMAAATIDVGMADFVLYALWSTTTNETLLQFEGNGGLNKAGGHLYGVPVPVNSTQTLAVRQPTGDEMFKREGYHFDGWMETENGTVTVASVFVGNDPKTVYAKWTKLADVKLTFNGNGGINKKDLGEYTINVPVNSTQTIADVGPKDDDVFRKAGYVFLGWTTVQNNASTLITTGVVEILEADVVIYALWSSTQQYVNVLFDGNGGANKTGVDPYPVQVLINSTQRVADIEPYGDNEFIKVGYDLLGWTLTKDDVSTLVTGAFDVGEANVTLYALWSGGPMYVQVTYDGNGDRDSTLVAIPVYKHLTFFVNAYAPEVVRPGYELLGWSTVKDDPNTLITDYIRADADMTVYALWSAGPIYVNLTFDGAGDAANTLKTVQILIHDMIDITDYAPQGLVKAGYTFGGWTTELNNAATRVTGIIQIDANLTVYAYWTTVSQSDTPNIDPIMAGDRTVFGQGVPGAHIDVTWPDGTTKTGANVDAGGNWSVLVPTGVNLVLNDIVTAIQTEPDKLPSTPAHETVGGGDKPGDGKSDTPDIFVIRAGDPVVKGRGTAGSKIEVVFEGSANPVIVTVGADDLWSAAVPAGIVLKEGDIVLARQTTGTKDPSDWAQRTVIDDSIKVSDTPNINPIEAGDRIVRGEGVPGSKIKVTWPHGGLTSEVTVDALGYWTAPVPATVALVLNDIVSAVQTETGKLPSVPAHETVGGGDKPGDGKSDTPDIDVIYTGDPTVGGVGTAGSKVTVRFPDGRTVTVTVGPDDRWTANVPSGMQLAAGDEVFAVQVTGAKQPSDWAQRTVIDKPAQLISDTPNIDPIKVGDKIVTGQGVPGSLIEVTWPNDATTQTYVDIAGNWTISVPTGLTLALNQIVKAVQTETGKLPSIPAHETVGGGDKPGDGKSDTPDIDVIRVGDTAVKGHGTPGSAIDVKFPGVAKPVRVTVGADGGWTANVPAGVVLAEGDVVLAQQITGTKDPSDWAQRTVIDDTPAISDTPNINPISAGAKSVTGEGIPGAQIAVTWPVAAAGPTTVTVDANGNWTAVVPTGVDLVEGNVVTAVQTEPGKLPSIPAHETVGGGDKPGDGKSDTPDIDPIYSGDRKIKGKGTPGSQILVRLPDNSVVPTVVDNNGLWSVDVPAGMELVAGDEVFALQKTGDKEPSDWAQRTVVDKPEKLRSDTPNINRIQPGDRSVSGQGVPGASIEVTWPDGAAPTVVTVDKAGNWSAQVPAGTVLATGQVVTAVQTEDGKLPSLPATETVGGNPLVKSDTPDIDVIYEGDTTITGRGTPGSQITVKLPGMADTVVTTVGQNTLWSIAVPAGLKLLEGDEVFAQQLTPGKLASDWAQRTVIGATQPLISDTPTIHPISVGDTFVTGEGVPGSGITVTWPNTIDSSIVTVDGNGLWTVNVPSNVVLALGDVVKAVQLEQGKLPSIPATATVGGTPGPGPSDTPGIDVIYEHANVITGTGKAGSKIIVQFPDYRTDWVTVGDDDRWSIAVPADLDLLEGDIVYAMQQTPGSGPSAWAQATVIAGEPTEVSDTPNIDPIKAGDRTVSGQGVPGAKVVVTWPNGGGTTETFVDPNGNWTVNVPSGTNLIAGNIVSAVQTEAGKKPSVPATETVGGVPVGKSDTPDVDVIYAGDGVITGRGTPGSKIDLLFNNGVVSATATVGENGLWSCDVPASVTLAVGDLVFARQTTGSLDPSDWVQRTVIDRDQPPVSDTPNINPIKASDVMVTGEGVPGAEIVVTWPNGQGTTTTTVDQNGNWGVGKPGNVVLHEGDVVTAVQTEDGKLPSVPATETVGGVPVLVSDTPDIDDIYEGDPVITGSGLAGSAIKVRIPDGRIIDTVVGANGKWSVDVPDDTVLLAGEEVSAQQITGGKQASAWAKHTVLAKPDELVSNTPNINPIKVGDKEVTGQGVPGAEIEVIWPNGQGSSKTTVDGDGKWAVTVPDNVELKVGDEVLAIQTEEGLLPSVPARESVGGMEIDKSDTPDINVIYEGDRIVTGRGTPGSIVRVKLPGADPIDVTVNAGGTWTVGVPFDIDLVVDDEVTAQQKTGNLLPSDIAMRRVIARPLLPLSDTPNIDPIDADDAIVTGQGVPGAEIEVVWPNNQGTSKAVVKPSGNWSVNVPEGVELHIGDVVQAIQTEEGKLPSTPATESVGGKQTYKSDTPDIDVIYAGDGEVTGRGTPGSDIKVKFPDETEGTVKVGANGLWKINVPQGLTLEVGDVVTAIQTTDPYLPSDEAQRTVIARPVRPTSDTPNINPIKPDDIVVTGEGVPGAEIEVTWPDGSTSTTTVSPNGNWIVGVPDDVTLEPGDKVIAVQTEPDKEPSIPAEQTVSGAPPVTGESDTPDIDVIYAGDTVITGAGDAGSLITVRFPDGRTKQTTVLANGKWSVDVFSDIVLVAGDIVEAMQRTADYDPSEWAQRTVIDRDQQPNISDTPNVNPINEGDKAVTGEGVPGAEIEITWPDGSTSTGTVDEDGNWTIPVPDDVDLHENDIVTVVQTEDGKEPSEPAHVTVGGGDLPGDDKSDTPNIDVIVEGDRTVSGNGVPGSQIIVKFKGNYIATATVGDDRLWTVVVPAGVELLEGDLVFAVQITGTKAPSDEAQRTVLGEAPPVRSDTPNIDPIKETDDTVTGQGVPGATIVVTWPDGSESETVVGPDGNWAVGVPDDVDLQEGDVVTAVQTEPGKPDSTPAHETVGGDTKDGPGDNDGISDTPDIDVIYEGAEVVTGRGTPGSDVVVKFRNGATVWVVVGDDSVWSADVPDGLEMRVDDLVFAQQFTEGKLPSKWAQRTVIEKGGPKDPDLNRSDTPNINPIKDTDKVVTGEGVRGALITVTWKDGSTSTAIVDMRGRWAVRVPGAVTLVEGDIVRAVQKEPGKLVSLPAHETVGGDTKDGPGDNDGKSDTPDIDEIYVGDDTVHGSGTPGSEITVRFKDNSVVKAVVDEDGKWAVDVPDGIEMEKGDKVYAMQKTPGKDPSDWAQRTVIDPIGPPNQSDTPNVSPIKEDDKVVTGTGVPGADIEVTWPDGSKSDTTVDEDGSWIVPVPDKVKLTEGDIVTAVQTEPDKEPSMPAHATVGGGDKDNKDDKSDTPNLKPIYAGDRKIKGTGVPGSDILVLFPNGDEVYTVVDDDGTWSVDVPEDLDLEVGDEIYALQSTPGKDPSDWVQHTVRPFELPRSDAPTIDQIDEHAPFITGRGVPYADIEVTWPNGEKTPAKVSRNGNWIALVPDGITLEAGEVVYAVQTEPNKQPSLPAQETVGRGEHVGDEISDTPDISPIYVGDEYVSGFGTPGAVLAAVFPNDATVQTVVDANGRWRVKSPVELLVGDVVRASQTSPGKLPSKFAQQTVRDGGDNTHVSDTPNVRPIKEGDTEVKGEGVPGADIEITWPDGSTSTGKVDDDGNWTIPVPEDVELKEDDIVTVVQTEPDKEPSVPAHVTVGGGDKEGDGVSDTPNVDVIHAGDRVINGDGVPGSTVAVRMPNDKIVTAKVNSNTKWSVDVPTGLELVEGDLIFALQHTPGKLPSDWVQKTVVAAPVGDSKQPTVNPVTEGDRTITGKGEPGAEIVVTWPDGSTSKTKVDDKGNWSVPVPPGINLQPRDRINVVQIEPGKAPSAPVTVTVGYKATQPSTGPGPGPGPGPTTSPVVTVTGGGRTGAVPTPTAKIQDQTPPLSGFIADHILYIKGYPWGTVAPDANITRAETAEIIYRLLEASKLNRQRTNPFPDVAMGEWYAQSVTYLASIGIIKGYLDGTFKPDNPITRAEFATMISGFDNLEIANYNKFSDVEGHWAVGYINSAATKGWVAGYPDGTFKPENYITRAEVVSVINRMLNRRIKIGDIPKWAPSYSDLSEAHWAYTDIIEASVGHEFERQPDGYEKWTKQIK